MQNIRFDANFHRILIPSCSYILKFAQALERLEEMGEVGSAAIIRAARDKRIDQSVMFPLPAPRALLSLLSDFRILERLADEGWSEQILSHREDYVRRITEVKGVSTARPLTGKGTTHTLENLRFENHFQRGRG